MSLSLTKNRYVIAAKNELNKAKDAAVYYRDAKDQNNSKYQPEVARAENERLRAILEAELERVTARLKELESQAIEEVARLDELDGAQITDDMKLLDGSFDLDATRVEQLKSKYLDNPTMLQALGDYAKKRKLPVIIPTAETRRGIYNRMFSRFGNCISMLRKMVSDAPEILYSDLAVSAIDRIGDEEEFAGDYEILGN